LIARVVGDGKLVGGPLVDIGRCIARDFAVLLRGVVGRIRSVLLIGGQVYGWCLVESLADLLEVIGVYFISNGFRMGRSFR
jgi:hypothetical protein